jgi:hypothetical protein
MNFDPELSSGTAIVLALIAAFMWGTWAISLKYLGDYPIDGFFVTLFVTSLVFVWAVGFLFDREALLENIQTVWSSDPSRVTVTFVCGVIYVFGIRFSLTVMSTIGLALAQPLQSATFNLASLAVTITVGGVPSGVSIPMLVLATLILIAAVIVSLLAGQFRSQAQAAHPGHSQYVPMSAIWRSLGLVLPSGLLLLAYPFGVSYGLQSTSQPEGMAVLPFMAVLATGAFCRDCALHHRRVPHRYAVHVGQALCSNPKSAPSTFPSSTTGALPDSWHPSGGMSTLADPA